MATLVFVSQGGDTIASASETHVEARSEGEIVVLTLPLSHAGPARISQVQIELSAPEAAHLAAQIQPAAMMARVRSKQS